MTATVYNAGWYELKFVHEVFDRPPGKINYKFWREANQFTSQLFSGVILLGQTKTFDIGQLTLSVIAASKTLSTYELRLWSGGAEKDTSIIAHGTTFNPWVEVHDG